jgi:rubrerythrin
MKENNSEGLTSLEALGIAIRAEMDAQEIYNELAERSEEQIIHRRFELLAAEEGQHRQYLTEHYRSLAGDIPLKLPPSQLPKDMLSRDQRSHKSLEGVLDTAIDVERHAREFFLRAARDTDDLSGRAMFRYLADMAYQHWLALGQEKDLLVRYPNYARRGKVPWRAEKSLKTGREGD